MSDAKVINLFSKSTRSTPTRKSKRVKLLDQANPDVDHLGSITVEVIRDDGGPWVYVVEDDGGPLESFTDLAEAMEYVKRTIEDSAKMVAVCESLRKTFGTSQLPGRSKSRSTRP